MSGVSTLPFLYLLKQFNKKKLNGQAMDDWCVNITLFESFKPIKKKKKQAKPWMSGVSTSPFLYLLKQFNKRN